MVKFTTGFSMSLDGFVAGPNDGPENSLGDGGDRLFKWYFSGVVLNHGWHFIEKPFLPDLLVDRITDLLHTNMRDQGSDRFDPRE